MKVTWTIACLTHVLTVGSAETLVQTVLAATAEQLQLATLVQHAPRMLTIAQLPVVSTAAPARTEVQSNGNVPALLATLGLAARLTLTIVCHNPVASTEAVRTAGSYLMCARVTAGTAEPRAM